MTDLSELKRLAEKATPGYLGVVYHEEYHSNYSCPESIENGCPGHDTDMVLELDGTFTNEDGNRQTSNDLEFLAGVSNPSVILELIERVEQAEALIQHALDMEHFTPGGSTEGWAKRILKNERGE